MTLRTGDVITQEVIREVVEDIAEEDLQFREAFRGLSATDINSNKYEIPIPKDDMGEPTAVEEGSEFPLEEHENDTIQVNFQKYGFATQITMETMEDSMLSVKANQVEQKARQMQEFLDRQAYDTLQSENDGVATQDSGADDVFDFADVMAGVTQLRGNSYAPDTLIVEPDAVGDLMLDEQFTDAASDSGHDTVRNGMIGEVAGVEVLVTQLEDIQIPAFSDTTHPGGILVDSDFYGFEVTRTPVSTNEYEDEGRQSDIIQTFTRKDWVSTKPEAAVFIEG